jgi:hypothetical protein
VLLEHILERLVRKLLNGHVPLASKLIERCPILGSEPDDFAWHQLCSSRSTFFRLTPTFFTTRFTAFFDLPVFFAS